VLNVRQKLNRNKLHALMWRSVKSTWNRGRRIGNFVEGKEENRYNPHRMTTGAQTCISLENQYYNLNLNFIFLFHFTKFDNILKSHLHGLANNAVLWDAMNRQREVMFIWSWKWLYLGSKYYVILVESSESHRECSSFCRFLQILAWKADT
jgi:hypothetical protein